MSSSSSARTDLASLEKDAEVLKKAIARREYSAKTTDAALVAEWKKEYAELVNAIEKSKAAPSGEVKSGVKVEVKSEAKIEVKYKAKAEENISYIFDDGKEISASMFVHPWKLEDKMCAICRGVYRRPVILDNTKRLGEVIQRQCGHMYCESCITKAKAAVSSARIISTSFLCPLCKKDSTGAIFFPAEEMARNIAKLEAKCEYESKGCKRILQIGIDGKDWRRHGDGCEFRGAPCAECREIVSWGKELAHQAICRMAIIGCDIDARCDKKFKRYEVKDHATRCMYRRWPCPMKVIGCDWVGPLADYKEHDAKASETHMSLVHRSVEEKKRMEAEKKRMEAEMKELKTKADEEAKGKLYFIGKYNEARDEKEKATETCKRKLYNDFGRAIVEVPWKNEKNYNCKSPTFELQGHEFYLGIYRNSVYVEPSIDIEWKANVALEDINGNVICTWNDGKMKKRINQGGGILTSERVSKALTIESKLRFRIILVQCGTKGNTWNSEYLRDFNKPPKIKKCKTNADLV